jgi:pyridoxal phosphate enzyme (YggS family)
VSWSADIAQNIATVRTHIAAAARAASRDPASITLIAASKEQPESAVEAAVAAGLFEFGENRVQELVPKAEALAGTAARWHMIGRLQRNKVRTAAPYVSLWQSVDRVALAEEIARRTPGASLLVQVNVAGEAQKGGCAPAETADLIDACRTLGCEVRGLMTIPPAATDPRPIFEQLRKMVDHLGLGVCSMGMSSDYEAAIAEGSTMVRVGTAIFGPRPGGADARR